MKKKPKFTGALVGFFLATTLGIVYIYSQTGASEHTNSGVSWFTVERFAKVSDNGSDVGYFGSISLIGGECLGIRTRGDAEGEGTVMLWPRGTQVERRAGQLMVRTDGHTFRLGDQVVAGKAETSDFMGPDVSVSLPTTCRDAPVRVIYDIDPE